MKKNIGKNTLGDNKKMEIDLRTYNRSTHNLGYIWRNTQSVGTLVPFMTEIALPGDKFDIELDASVLTHPTVGPLFGSFKLQCDIFTAPIRLYHGWLHNNKLNIGLNMEQVKLPQMQVTLNTTSDRADTDEFCQINPSALLSYLGLRGWGTANDNNRQASRNAIPLLAYWDIFKNYYANKQEENAYVIGGVPLAKIVIKRGSTTIHTVMTEKLPSNYVFTVNDVIEIYPGQGTSTPPAIILFWKGTDNQLKPIPITEWATTEQNVGYTSYKIVTIPEWYKGPIFDAGFIRTMSILPKLFPFPLKNLDDMREKILYHNNATPFMLDKNSQFPYGGNFNRAGTDGKLLTSMPQYGLAVKTYNSDLFNNWINTDWIDGTNGINAISAVSTNGGSFTIDALNVAKKVYEMLNRVAVSGGSYNDWCETIYSGRYGNYTESPMFEGGMSQEIVFQEVISNAATADEPLGTLAGRGRLMEGKRGGKIAVKVDEPSYLMGIVSITPRIDYNQGNRFDTTLKTLNDLHKPQLDGIGFQDLVTDKMAWWSSFLVNNNEIQHKSVGKQPAWIDYMSNYNRTCGNFAIRDNEGFMVLNRMYERAAANKDFNITDLTTYIDPKKFNYIFADTDLSAMNYWVQIKVDMKVRRLISAKEIPNL